MLLLFALAVLAVDITASLYLTNVEPDDGKIYSQIAKNVVAYGVFSTDLQQPIAPTIIRLPGYPLFLAGIYSIFGVGNDSAVHFVQGLLLFGAAVLAGLIAWNWASGKRRRRRSAGVCTFFLTGLCPFTLNYSGVLLTETATMFLMAAMTLTATYAIKAASGRTSVLWWAIAGLAAGLAVEFRPDSGMFALGLGLTLVIAAFVRSSFRGALTDALLKGAIFSLVFLLVMTPWAIRNYRVFDQFQPLAPSHAEMPGEFVPHGYFLWLRTWITDIKYVSPMLWDLEQKPIAMKSIPDSAFSNDEEKTRVAALLEQYNNSDPDHPMKSDGKPAESNDDQDDDSSDKGADDEDDSGSEDKSDEASANSDENTDEEWDLKISPEADAAFEQIARERITNRPLHFYVELPAIRASNMWFDTHSEYYAFAGELFPIKDLDSETYQNLWLPLFAGIVWAYTILAVAGLLTLLIAGWPRGWLWAAMVLLLTVPRIVFLGMLENPEPRYLVGYFMFAAILGGVALSRVGLRCGGGRLSLSLLYGRERNGRVRNR